MKQVVGFILLDSENRILLQHRTNDAPTDASKWSIFGGGVEKGELPLKAVKRECLEELDYKLKNPKIIYKETIENELVYIYLEYYDSKKELELKEGQAMKWYTFDELKNTDLAKHTLEILTKIKIVLEKK